MKIRTRLTLQNTSVVAAVFLLCMALIYFMSERARSSSFYHTLKSEAVTKAHLFLNNQVDASTMQSIYLNNRKFINEVEVAVYDPDFNMLYHDAIQNDMVKEDREMMERILRKRDIEFYIGDCQAIGMVYTYAGRDYIVTAAAYDGYGYDNLHELGKILIFLFVVGLTLLFATCYYLAYASLKPIRGIVREAEKITALHIDRRLPVKNEKDELGELSLAFNALLERLEASFNSQKMFVSNVSHEMRTPLSSLTAELDLSLQKERTGDEYRDSIRNALQDAGRMTSLIDGLLNLARADYMKEQIKMQEIRLDELLLDAREHILKAHPEYRIELIFAQEEADDDRMDAEYLRKPRKWDASDLSRFMIFIGPISSIFDIATYLVMWYVFSCSSVEHQSLFQSGCFIEGLLSQTLIVHMIRTRKIPFVQSRASWPVTGLTILIMATGIAIPFTSFGSSIGLVPLPLSYFPWLAGILLSYCVLTQTVKDRYIKRFVKCL